MVKRDPESSAPSNREEDSAETSQDDILKGIAQEELELFNVGRERVDSGELEHQLQFIGEKMKAGSKRSGREVMKDILTSVAMEQTSMSYLVQAEANKIKAFTGASGNFPTMPTNQNITDFQNSTARVVEALVEKQKLLIRMVEISKRILDGGEHGDEEL
ncbi:hypothetical protein J7E73_01020 [Paenibacillus albidus]|uniref:hypothetical protein n=1 Tax=Paenibacillus albidus TaxID=2041023 RepID=UPI001BEA5982|nr:hypothetical protein [Paenibacillus albidus]MBT2287727.1 hypothetical protein [Paenibacillus albidus]